VLIVLAAAVTVVLRTGGDHGIDPLPGATDWPARGQASVVLGSGSVRSSSGQSPVPIASVAKVMTAYVVLSADPLPDGADGFGIKVTDADVADTVARRQDGQSIVPVRAGEILSERQALAALLLPSANNVAVLLARQVAGSVQAFVAQMNRTAREMGMTRTTYTDPSGFDQGTRSTAADQAVLAQVVMRVPAFAAMVGIAEYRVPGAGTVRNTDALLGSDGFVGIKTGSDDAAGGCFMFRSRRLVDGRVTDVTGVVLGQPGADLITAGLTAASRLVDQFGPAVAG
jgi:D-alanyl-D-alanine carboxypeptidase (penicillin-binding protein 5/6)